MLKKSTAHVAALYKDLNKSIERQIFGFLERHISHPKFTDAIF